MNKNLRRAVSLLLTLLLGLLLFAGATELLTPRYAESTWHVTRTVDGFYDEPAQSIDVLLLGSSNMSSAISPVELYRDYGITAYNLATAKQSMLISYFWLKEALRTQSPRVVVMDALFLLPYSAQEPNNMTEAIARQSFDSMRWSSVKLQAVREVCALDKTQSFWSYVFPILRFHDRYTALTRSDFLYPFRDRHDGLKGFTVLPHAQPSDYTGFVQGSTAATEPLMALMVEYFDRMLALCRENDAALVLIKTPRMGAGYWNEARSNAVRALADARGVPFIDFNDSALLTALRWDNQRDYPDVSHVNYSGAQKLSAYLGARLRAAYALPDRRLDPRCARWEEDVSAYESEVRSYCLSNCTDLSAYLQALCTDRYSVFLAAQGATPATWPPATSAALAQMGFSKAGRTLPPYYLAVKTPERLYESANDEAARCEGTLSGCVGYRVVSGADTEILLDGLSRMTDRDGLHIVVYDNIRQTVLDQVCFPAPALDAPLR